MVESPILVVSSCHEAPRLHAEHLGTLLGAGGGRRGEQSFTFFFRANMVPKEGWLN